MLVSQGPPDNPKFRRCSDMDEVYAFNPPASIECEKQQDSTTIYDGKNYAKSIDVDQFLERLRNCPISTFSDIEMAAWMFVGGFWGREIFSSPSVKVPLTTGPAELTTDLSHLAYVHQKFIEFNKEADDLNDEPKPEELLWNTRIFEYADGSQALSTGGNWDGVAYEWAVARWPDLPREICPFYDKLSALANGIASFHRDAYDDTTNSLDGIFGLGSEDVSRELSDIITGIVSSNRSLRVASLHMFCITNYGKRYAFWVNLTIFIRRPIHVDKSSFAQDLHDIFGAAVNQDEHAKIFLVFFDIIDVVTKAFNALSDENALLSPELWLSQMCAVNSQFATAVCDHLEDGYSAMAATVATQALLNAVFNMEWILPVASDPCRTILSAINGRAASVKA
ncbi:hypothetical protein FBU30_003457 [Linnemannia zychae]|nr:hypothetical protein FBU30_003457 [Linnemannia zychae]